MIPKQLHAYWSGPPMPAELAGHLDRWRELHPDWQLTLWGDQSVPPLRNQRFIDDPARWSPKSNRWQHTANLVRYELLYDLGGVWVDCDLEPLRPIDDLIIDVQCFAAWEKQDRWVNNAFMGAKPKHPAIGELIDQAPASIERQPHRRSNWQSGAKFITPILSRRDDVTIFDQRLVYPYRWDQLDEAGDTFPEAWVVHRWHNQSNRKAIHA